MIDRRRWTFLRIVISLPSVWLLLFFLLPLLIVLKVSFSETAIAMPPYRPLFSGLDLFFDRVQQFTFSNYLGLADGSKFPGVILSSLMIATLTTAIILLVGCPLAYAMSCASGRIRHILLMAVVLSFATSMLVRAYAWIDILSATGLLSQILLAAGLVSEPLAILNTDLAVCIAIVYCYLPLMIMPLYLSFVRLDRSLLDAAADLGASPMRRFWQVTLPLSWPAIACGCLLVFVPAFGNFIIPDLLGGPDVAMIGKTLWADFSGRNWPLASAVAILVVIILAIPMFAFAKTGRYRAGGNS